MQTLLDYIARYESGGDYNVVWGGIPRDRRPARLTSMTIEQVLDWQGGLNTASTAAGRYQIIRPTLQGLYGAAGLRMRDLFNEANQDRMATVLCRRRGLNDYLDGKMTAEAFCNSLAKEWAALPLVSGPKRGRSYYAGDGLNSAHADPDEFLAVVRGLREPKAPVRGLLAALWGFIQSIIRSIRNG